MGQPPLLGVTLCSTHIHVPSHQLTWKCTKPLSREGSGYKTHLPSEQLYTPLGSGPGISTKPSSSTSTPCFWPSTAVTGLNRVLGVPSPFFPGILLSTKPPKTLGKQLVFEKKKNGESTPRRVRLYGGCSQGPSHGMTIQKPTKQMRAPTWEKLPIIRGPGTLKSTPIKRNLSRRLPGFCLCEAPAFSNPREWLRTTKARRFEQVAHGPWRFIREVQERNGSVYGAQSPTN